MKNIRVSIDTSINTILNVDVSMQDDSNVPLIEEEEEMPIATSIEEKSSNVRRKTINWTS